MSDNDVFVTYYDVYLADVFATYYNVFATCYVVFAIYIEMSGFQKTWFKSELG